MGKAYSTQLKIRNDTSSRITTNITRINPKQWFGPNRPDLNFHNVSISPGSEYSREECINIRSPISVFTMELKFDDNKQLVFRIDQGRVAGKKRCRLGRKEKDKFTFVGDDTAFDVKDTISGNTLTIEIKDSYMFQYGSKEEARKKAEMIAKEQAKAAELARAKADADKKAYEEEKARREALARKEEEERAKADEERRRKEEAELEAERTANRLADAAREKARIEEEKGREVTHAEREGVSQVTAGALTTESDGGDVDGNVQVEIGKVVHVALPDESRLRSNGDGDVTRDRDAEIILTTVKFEPQETVARHDRSDGKGHRRKSSSVTLQVLMNQDGDIRVQIEEIPNVQDRDTSDDESEMVHVRVQDVCDVDIEEVKEVVTGFDKRELQIKDIEIPPNSSQVVMRSRIESHF